MPTEDGDGNDDFVILRFRSIFVVCHPDDARVRRDEYCTAMGIASGRTAPPIHDPIRAAVCMECPTRETIPIPFLDYRNPEGVRGSVNFENPLESGAFFYR